MAAIHSLYEPAYLVSDGKGTLTLAPGVEPLLAGVVGVVLDEELVLLELAGTVGVAGVVVVDWLVVFVLVLAGVRLAK